MLRISYKFAYVWYKSVKMDELKFDKNKKELIECVRKHEVLYDKAHPEYKNKQWRIQGGVHPARTLPPPHQRGRGAPSLSQFF